MNKWQPWPPLYRGRPQWLWVRTEDDGGWPGVHLVRLEKYLEHEEAIRYVRDLEEYHSGRRKERPPRREGVTVLRNPYSGTTKRLEDVYRRATHYMVVVEPSEDLEATDA